MSQPNFVCNNLQIVVISILFICILTNNFEQMKVRFCCKGGSFVNQLLPLWWAKLSFIGKKKKKKKEIVKFGLYK